MFQHGNYSLFMEVDTMTHDPKACSDCTQGCTAKYTDERTSEEVNSAPYLLVCAAVILLLSLAMRWLFLVS